MGTCPIKISVGALGLLLILIGLRAGAAQEVLGAFNAPPVGTIAEYTDRKFQIRGVEDYVVEYEERRVDSGFAAVANRLSYGWLWNDESSAKVEMDAGALERFSHLRWEIRSHSTSNGETGPSQLATG